MTLSDERLREIAAYQPLEFRISGSELISMARELLSRRASPHGEAGEQDAEPEYDLPDHHAVDGSGDVQPFEPTVPGLVRNESAGFYEFVSEDVPTLTGPVRAANVEPILRMEGPRGEVLGFRIYDAPPASGEVVVDCVGEAHDHPSHDWHTACLKCGVFRGTDLYASPPSMREGLEAASVVVNALGRAADFLLGVSTQTGTTSEYRDKALAARFAIISAIRALSGEQHD